MPFCLKEATINIITVLLPVIEVNYKVKLLYSLNPTYEEFPY